MLVVVLQGSGRLGANFLGGPKSFTVDRAASVFIGERVHIACYLGKLRIRTIIVMSTHGSIENAKL